MFWFCAPCPNMLIWGYASLWYVLMHAKSVLKICGKISLCGVMYWSNVQSYCQRRSQMCEEAKVPFHNFICWFWVLISMYWNWTWEFVRMLLFFLICRDHLLQSMTWEMIVSGFFAHICFLGCLWTIDHLQYVLCRWSQMFVLLHLVVFWVPLAWLVHLQYVLCRRSLCTEEGFLKAGFFSSPNAVQIQLV